MIQKVLVANRGEIARRIFRTCRSMGLETVAVVSDPDTDEPHASEADHLVRLRGSAPSDTYLDIEAVLAAATETGADAVHPGYGFLAENPAFARSVTNAGLTWIGPSPEAIEIMGSKVESKRLVQSVGVPTIPGSELADLSVPNTAAEALGLPVLVKASAGGGGKGMRVVSDVDLLAEAIESARREAASSFGDDTVFIEKYLPAPRHIEIQIFGDTHGNVVSLFERECSIQRRHQKIVEESPSPAVNDSLRAAMGEAAVAVAGSVEYSGAGTVEFLVQDGEFFFLEMNTRLQVEHPVTEAITGLDLVKLQIDVANGAELPSEATFPSINGHAIEARLYAEDPLNEFLPVTGQVHKFSFEHVDGLRVESGVEDGSVVTVHYDPMMAKVIAHAPTREEARLVLAGSLRSARLHGSTTNRDLLVRILESDEFRTGEIDTHLLERHDLDVIGAPLATEVDEAYAARAAALADQALERDQATVQRTIPSGFRNLTSQPQRRAYEGHHAQHHVSYRISPGHAVFEDQDHSELETATPDRVEFTRCDVGYRFDIARYGDILHVDSPDIPVRLERVPRFPSVATDDEAGSLVAPMPGKIVRVDAMAKDVIKEGQILVVLEAMKMEHTIKAPHAGRVKRVACAPGDQVEADAVLVVIEDRTDD